MKRPSGVVLLTILAALTVAVAPALAAKPGWQVDEVHAAPPRQIELSPLPVCTMSGWPLIFTDMPEVLQPWMTGEGNTVWIGTWRSITEPAAGPVRFFTYQQNHGERDLYYCAAISNTSSQTAYVYVRRDAWQQLPEASDAGRNLVKAFYQCSGLDTFWGTIPAGITKYYAVDYVPKGNTGEKMVDFNVTDSSGYPLEVTYSGVISDVIPPDNVPNSTVFSYGVLPWVEKYGGDVVGITRGKWNHCNRHSSFTVDMALGTQYVRFGNDPRQTQSPWLEGEREAGWSTVDNKEVDNWGNYGVDYYLDINFVNIPANKCVDSLYQDKIHWGGALWWYCHFIGDFSDTGVWADTVGVHTASEVVVVHKNNTDYNVKTQVCPGSNHPLWLDFYVDAW